MGNPLPKLVSKLRRRSSATQSQAGAKSSASSLGVGQKMLGPCAPGAARTPSCSPGLCRGPRRAWARFGAEAHSHPPVAELRQHLEVIEPNVFLRKQQNKALQSVCLIFGVASTCLSSTSSPLT